MNYCFRIFIKLMRNLLNIRLYVLFWTGLIPIILFVIWIVLHYNVMLHDNTNLKIPVILWWTKGFPGTSEIKQCSKGVKCHVTSDHNVDTDIGAFLFYGSNINFNDLPLPRRPQTVIWGLYHEESPRNVEELLHEQVLSLFNFSSTFSRYSDVPYPLQYLSSLNDLISTEYFVETAEKNSLLKEFAPVLYLQSDCQTSTERDEFVKELMNVLPVDSYGACLNNKQLAKKFRNDYLNNLNEEEFLKFIAKYKLVIAIENGVCEDYITEKLWRALRVGSVPIYFGSPSIRDWLPNDHSAILLQDYGSVHQLKRHITDLMNNDTLYEGYLEHKLKQIIRNRRLIENFRLRPWSSDGLETADRFECLVCERLHERLEGNSDIHIVNRTHYNCPKPISALSLSVNPDNTWVFSWENARQRAERISRMVLNQDRV